MSIQQPDSIATMSAATRVFTIPELVEDILNYLPALALYRLRRVNSTFCDTISRQRCRTAMLLEPSPRLSLFRLTCLLQSPNIQRAIRPFKISLIHTASDNRTLRINIETVSSHRQQDIDRAAAKIESEVLPCTQMNVSWRQVRLDRGEMALRIRFGKERGASVPPFQVIHYGAKEMTTLGDLIDLAIV